MNKNNFSTMRTVFISLLSLFVFSCASIPTSIELQPSINNQLTTASLKSTTKWAISSQDFRVALYLIEISKGDDVAILVNESKSSRKLIEGQLSQYWQKNGLLVNSDKSNNTKISIELQEMLSKTKQASFSHKTTEKIRIKITLSNDSKTFSKTFKSRNYNEAGFSANIETLNTNLTNHLSDLLEQIVQDDELNNKLSHF